MKKIMIFSLGLIILMSFRDVNSSFTPTGCDVRRFYEAITPEFGVKVITALGELVEPELILVPTQLDEGSYQVYITREANNMYKIEGTTYYMETVACYEYVYFQEAILKVLNAGGYNYGTIFFD